MDGHLYNPRESLFDSMGTCIISKGDTGRELMARTNSIRGKREGLGKSLVSKGFLSPSFCHLLHLLLSLLLVSFRSRKGKKTIGTFFSIQNELHKGKLNFN